MSLFYGMLLSKEEPTEHVMGHKRNVSSCELQIEAKLLKKTLNI